MRASELLHQVIEIRTVVKGFIENAEPSPTGKSIGEVVAEALSIPFLANTARLLLEPGGKQNLVTLINDCTFSEEVLRTVAKIDSPHTITVRLPPEIGGLDQLVGFFASSKEFLQYPALGVGLEPPKFTGCENGSAWVTLTFSAANPFLLTMACLGVIFAMMAGLTRAALMFKQLQRYSDMSELQAKFLSDARETILRDHRAQLEDACRNFGQLSDSERNEWISHLQNISLKEFEAQIKAGMEIGYVADMTAESLKSLKSLPPRFNTLALDAVAKSEVLQLEEAVAADEPHTTAEEAPSQQSPRTAVKKTPKRTRK